MHPLTLPSPPTTGEKGRVRGCLGGSRLVSTLYRPWVEPALARRSHQHDLSGFTDFDSIHAGVSRRRAQILKSLVSTIPPRGPTKPFACQPALYQSPHPRRRHDGRRHLRRRGSPAQVGVRTLPALSTFSTAARMRPAASFGRPPPASRWPATAAAAGWPGPRRWPRGCRRGTPRRRARRRRR